MKRSWWTEARPSDEPLLLMLIADASRCASPAAARTKIRHQSARVQRQRRYFTRETARLASARAQLGDHSSSFNDLTPPRKDGSRSGHCLRKIVNYTLILFNFGG